MKLSLLYFDTIIIFVNLQSLPFVLPPPTQTMGGYDSVQSSVLVCDVVPLGISIPAF